MSESALVLNPVNLITLEKIKNELNSDEALTQTLKIISTKKESETDLKYTIVKNGGENATIINVPKDIDKTHPYTTTEIVKKIQETLELTFGQIKIHSRIFVEIKILKVIRIIAINFHIPKIRFINIVI